MELGEDAADPTAAYVRSAGAPADRQRLLAAPSWQQRDGRASQAMLRLIDRQRTLAHAGADIQIACFDATPAGQPFSDPTRSNAIDHSPPGSWPSGNDARAWPSRATSTGGIPDVNATAVWLAVPRRVLGIALAILRAKH